jgi:hypothetical protein
VAEELALDPARPPLVDAVARHLSGDAFETMLGRSSPARRLHPGAEEADLKALLDLPEDACEESLLACIEERRASQLLRDLAALCARRRHRPEGRPALLQVCGTAPSAWMRWRSWSVFPYGEGAEKNGPFTAKSTLPTKTLRRQGPRPDRAARSLMRDVEAARELRLCLQAYARNGDLHAFASAS